MPSLKKRLGASARWIVDTIQRRTTQPPPSPIPAGDCAACDSNTAPIGAPDHDVRVLAFGGGGYDAVMQLGVVHALVVADAVPPDLVVGLSVGAVNAAALAEVLRADAGLRVDGAAPRLCREARMSRFREFLYEAQEMPSRVREILLPDTHEADAGMALETHRLATHEDDERTQRQQALRTRSGLVEFLNIAARLQLTVATATRYVRCFLGLRAARALPLFKRWRERVRETSRLFRTAAAHLPSTLQTLFVLVRAAVWGRVRRRRGFPAGDILFRSTKTTCAMMVLFAAALAAVFLQWFTPVEDLRLLLAIPRPIAFIGELALLSAAVVFIRYAVPTSLYLLVGAIGLVAIAIPIRRTRLVLLRILRDRFLDHHDLLRDLGGAYYVRDALVRLFDPQYFGQQSILAVARKIATPSSPVSDVPREQRTFDAYTATVPRIHVVPVAAHLARGDLTALPQDTPIVDGLAAATAAPPLMSAVQLGEAYYVDGTSVSTEPTTAVRELLRHRVHPEATSVQLYMVSSLPVEANEVPSNRPRRYAGLVDVLMRVRQLRRFRHAKLDRAITALYDGALPFRRMPPERKADGKIRALKCFGNGQHVVRTTVVPIEPGNHAITLSEELVRASSRKEQQDAVARTVAVGCRLTLETLLADDAKTVADGGAAACAGVIAKRRGQALIGDMPGATEICSSCSVMIGELRKQSLSVRDADGAPWPVDRWLVPDAPRVVPEVTIPVDTKPLADVIKPPTVSLLFSGGVFRGVFLIGVLNALQQLRVQPQVVAGSSVGSITAGMAARIFSIRDPDEQQTQVGLVAHTYLSLDELLVTDRFSDFVRRLTLRAGEANFSLADIDDVVRSYDRPTNGQWLRAARRLAGGMEHLLYVSPFDLLALARSFRSRNARRTYRLLRRYFQEVLDRGGVALELLGTEPLSFLIREHVLEAEHRQRHTVPFDAFAGDLAFLVTATNLTAGKLETIGAPAADGRIRSATLVDALLASSAFPGVFRPRWGWEVFADEGAEHQLVDGGVMDNLPLDAVVGHLSRQAALGNAAVRPENNVPHLIFTASLERDLPELSPVELRRVAERWPSALQHAREMRYNRKIDTFATAQRDFRRIYHAYRDRLVELPRVPLDIEAVVVKPKWLCGTFSFHPMLGFKRSRQAASIAHGCASTLAKVADLDADFETSKWLDGWQFDADVRSTLDRPALATLTPRTRKDGLCHFRSSGSCPFSAAATKERLDRNVSRNLNTIYEACGKRRTHRAGA